MNPSPVRLGVLGAGWFASRRHIPDAMRHPDVQLEAICRRDDEAREKIAAHFDIPRERALADWQRMLQEVELDAVLIATPNALHYPQAKAALERGLHVLVEKPMTLKSSEAWELVELAKSKNLQLAVALNPPYWAHCHQIRRALHDPKMGDLETVSLLFSGSVEYVFGRSSAPEHLPGVVAPTMYRADPELNGGGNFADGGSHLVSELLWITGRKARRVTALTDCLPCDMRVAASIELDSGVLATIASVGDSKYSGKRVQNLFTTSHGSVQVTNPEFDTVIVTHGQGNRTFSEAELAKVESPIANFVAAIRHEGHLYAPGEHGAQVVQVVEAIYESARSGKTMELNV